MHVPALPNGGLLRVLLLLLSLYVADDVTDGEGWLRSGPLLVFGKRPYLKVRKSQKASPSFGFGSRMHAGPID